MPGRRPRREGKTGWGANLPASTVVVSLLLVLSLSGVLGASLGGGHDTVERLEREAERDERGADREAEKAETLDKELGDSAMATRYAKLQREIDDDGGKDSAKASVNFGGRDSGGLARGAGSGDVAGETAIESIVKEGEKVVAMAEDMSGPVDGDAAHANPPGDDEDEVEPRDLIAEAEVEGGCLGECEGACTPKCNNNPLMRSKGDLETCRRECEHKCVASCRDEARRMPPAPNSRAARMQTRQKARAGREIGKEVDASTEPGKQWGWQERMEEDEAAGKLVGPAPVRAKPMDEECKKECMGSCQRKCKKRSRTPEKCPAQCKEQCEDDCYIVENGAPPDADVFMPGNGEEGLGDEPNKLMKRCMGECHEQCMPPCSERGDAASGRKQTQRQVAIAIHLNCRYVFQPALHARPLTPQRVLLTDTCPNCSQVCRESCLGSCEPMVTRRVQDIRQDLRNREHKFFGKEEPRPAGSQVALSPAEQPSPDEVLAAARFSDCGDFGFQRGGRAEKVGGERAGGQRGSKGLKARKRNVRVADSGESEQQGEGGGGGGSGRGRFRSDGHVGMGVHWSGEERDAAEDAAVMASSVGMVSALCG